MNTKEQEIGTEVQFQLNNRAAFQYVIGSVLLFSILPIVFSVSNAVKAPFLFSAMLQYSACISYVVYLLNTNKHPSISSKETIQLIKNNWFNPTIRWAVIGTFSYALFAFSLKYIGISIATVLRQTGPLFVIFITAYLFRSQNRYKRITPKTIALLLIGFSGVVLVILSGYENIGASAFVSTSIIGIGAVIIAAISQSLIPAHSLKWGSNISNKINASDTNHLFFTIIALVIIRMIGGSIAIIAGLALSEDIGDIEVMPAILFGLTGTGLAAILLREGNIKTDNLLINALSFSTPAISLIWLMIATLIKIPHIEYLIVGTLLIILTNIFLNRP